MHEGALSYIEILPLPQVFHSLAAMFKLFSNQPLAYISSLKDWSIDHSKHNQKIWRLWRSQWYDCYRSSSRQAPACWRSGVDSICSIYAEHSNSASSYPWPSHFSSFVYNIKDIITIMLGPWTHLWKRRKKDSLLSTGNGLSKYWWARPSWA